MARSGAIPALGVLLVVASAFYLIALCGLFSIGVPITNGVIAAADAAIVVAALLLAASQDVRLLLLPLLALAANVAALALLSGNADLKSARDALIICVFLALGAQVGNMRTVTAAVVLVCVGVLGFGLFEALAPEAYAHSFNVLQFYIMRGEVDPIVATYSHSGLFVSSLRGDGRALASFLDLHRVSSIFLEPVSMGNFGAILLAFALALPKRYLALALFAGATAVFAIVAADARFAAGAAVLFLAARFIPLDWARLVLALAPIAAILALLAISAFVTPVGDTLFSRLSASGHVIANLSPLALVGAMPADPAAVDSGYAYAISKFGLPFCILLWTAFVLLPTPGQMSARFKLLFGLYMTALLCVSGSSLFALKTAALAWFVLGGLIAADGARAKTALPKLRVVARRERTEPSAA